MTMSSLLFGSGLTKKTNHSLLKPLLYICSILQQKPHVITHTKDTKNLNTELNTVQWVHRPSLIQFYYVWFMLCKWLKIRVIKFTGGLGLSQVPVRAVTCNTRLGCWRHLLISKSPALRSVPTPLPSPIPVWQGTTTFQFLESSYSTRTCQHLTELCCQSGISEYR